MNGEFERQIETVRERLRILPPKSVAIFSAACAERLAGFYEQFTAQNGWDCYPAVRLMLDLCWDVLLGDEGRLEDLKARSADLLRFVPHADDFTGILCMGAQDFAACVETTVKWISNAPTARHGAGYYAVEALSAAAVHRRGLAGGSNHLQAESFIMSDPAVIKEFGAQEADLRILERSGRVMEQDVVLIRNTATANRHRVSGIYGS